MSTVNYLLQKDSWLNLNETETFQNTNEIKKAGKPTFVSLSIDILDLFWSMVQERHKWVLNSSSLEPKFRKVLLGS